MQFLKTYNILGVLTVAQGANLSYKGQDIKFHKILDVVDEDIQDLRKYFDEAIEFIDNAR